MAGNAAQTEPLVCPGCEKQFAPEERFCPNCKLPLTYGSQQAAVVSKQARQVRKIKPQLAEGELVRVVGASNQAEAEFIQGLLLEEGVPSLMRRSAGFDVPDFLAAGPRDVLVPESGVATARQVLLEAELVPATQPQAAVAPLRLLGALIAILILGVLVVWVLVDVV